MEFKQLEAFVNVVKYKSFSKAAEATYLTQPTISTHINSLERELGTKLIDRKGKESRPTKQGRAFYNYAINIINTRDRAINAMDDFGKTISGTIEIKTSSIPGKYLVPKLVAGFAEIYPDVTFNIEESDSNQVSLDINDNMGEIGFVGTVGDNSLKYETVFRDRSVIITPKNKKFTSLMMEKHVLVPKDISGEKLILRSEGSATRLFLESWMDKEDYMHSRTVCTVNSMDSVKALVKAGVGISVMSLLSIDESDKTDMHVFEMDGHESEREFFLVYNRNTTLSPQATRFKDYILSVCNE